MMFIWNRTGHLISGRPYQNYGVIGKNSEWIRFEEAWSREIIELYGRKQTGIELAHTLI